MNQILTIVSILLSTLTAYTIYRRFLDTGKETLLEKGTISFGMGVGLIAYSLSVVTFIGIPWTSTFIVGIQILIVALQLNKLSLPKIKINRKRFSLIAILITVTFAYVLFQSQLRPLYAWDGWAIWLLQAKYFFYEKGVESSFFRYAIIDYPTILGTYSSYIYLVLGKVDDKAVLLFFNSFYLALGLHFYATTKRYTNKKTALIFTFLLISTQNLMRHGGRYEAGHADLPLAFFIYVSTITTIQYWKAKNSKTLLTCFIFFGLMALTKNEGLPLSILLSAVVISTMRKEHKKHIKSAVFWVVPVIIWQLYKIIHQVPPNNFVKLAAIDIYEIPIVLSAFSKEFVKVQNWNLLWITFVVSVVYSFIKKRDSKTNIIALVVFFQLITYALVLLVAPTDITEHALISDRLLIHIAPVATLLSAITFNKSTKSICQRFKVLKKIYPAS